MTTTQRSTTTIRADRRTRDGDWELEVSDERIATVLDDRPARTWSALVTPTGQIYGYVGATTMAGHQGRWDKIVGDTLVDADLRRRLVAAARSAEERRDEEIREARIVLDMGVVARGLNWIVTGPPRDGRAWGERGTVLARRERGPYYVSGTHETLSDASASAAIWRTRADAERALGTAQARAHDTLHLHGARA